MIQPTGNFVLIKAKKAESVTEGGIVLPEDLVKKEQMVEQTGEVVAFGPTAFKRWKGCEAPGWLDRAIKRFSECQEVARELPMAGSLFDSFCEYEKWDNPEFPPYVQWGIEVGDTVEHRKYDAKDSVVEGHENLRFIPDIEILGVIKHG